MNNQLPKILFGFVIFLFGVALAYFTANYLRTNDLFDYWGAIAIFAAAYAVIGISISMIFPVSLGFLFGADVLILHLLYQYYGRWANELKLAVVGAILIILYTAAVVFFKEKNAAVPAATAATP